MHIVLETRRGMLENIFCDDPELMTTVNLRVIEREMPGFQVTVNVITEADMQRLIATPEPETRG